MTVAELPAGHYWVQVTAFHRVPVRITYMKIANSERKPPTHQADLGHRATVA